MHKELRRFDIQLLGHFLAQQAQGLAAVPAGAGLGFMAVFDAGQVLRQRLPTGSGARGTRLGLQGFDALLQFGLVARPGFFEQGALLGVQRFRPDPEPDPFMVSQLQLQRLDQQFRVLQLMGQLRGVYGCCRSGIECAHDLRKDVRIKRRSGEFCEQIHAWILLEMKHNLPQKHP